MLNLLFISDSPKTTYIKSVLQPDLKVIIDVVADFDLGLKNIFGKRPSIVCIQDQIGGVTGENVARHIQMLLGNNAPKFILLLTGNSNTRLIKGLYDHTVDLNQPNETVSKDITTTLKALLGDEWEKIYIQPKLTPALVRPSSSIPEELQDDIDKLIDVALSVHKPSGSSAVIPLSGAETAGVLPHPPTKEFDIVSERHTHAKMEPVHDNIIAKKPPETVLNVLEKAEVLPSVPEPVVIDTPLRVKSAPITTPPPTIPTTPASTETTITARPLAPPAVSDHVKTEKKLTIESLDEVHIPHIIPELPAAAVSEFTVHVHPPSPPAKAENNTEKTCRNMPQTEERIPEDPNPVFGESGRSDHTHVRHSFVIAIVIAAVCFIGFSGGWYFMSQKPLLPQTQTQDSDNSKKTQQLPTPARPIVPVQKPTQPPAQQAVIQPQQLEFISKEGRDLAYAKSNPGWERYTGAEVEFKVFSVSGQPQAIQVFAMKNIPISKPTLNAVLQGFAGSTDCRITSRSIESGVRIESGTIRNKYDVMLYRKDGALIAFAVSIN